MRSRGNHGFTPGAPSTEVLAAQHDRSLSLLSPALEQSDAAEHSAESPTVEPTEAQPPGHTPSEVASGKRPVKTTASEPRASIAVSRQALRQELRNLIPSRQFLIETSADERAAAVSKAAGLYKTPADIKRAARKIERCRTIEELHAYVNAFMEEHIAAAKALGKPLVVMMLQSHYQQTTALTDMAIMRKALDEYGSQLTLAIEVAPGGYTPGAISRMERGLPQKLGSKESRDWDEAFGSRMKYPDDKPPEAQQAAWQAIKVSTTDASVYFGHRLGYFISGFDIKQALGHSPVVFDLRENAMKADLLKKLSSAKAGSKGGPPPSPQESEDPAKAMLVMAGFVHGTELMNSLSDAAHIACLAPVTFLGKAAEREPDHVPRISQLLGDPTVSPFHPHDVLDSHPQRYLAYARRHLGLDMSLEGAGGKEGLGRPHAEHAMAVVKRLQQENASASTYGAELWEQKAPLMRHLGHLIDAASEGEKQGSPAKSKDLMAEALRLGGGILPLFGADGNSWSPTIKEGEDLYQRLAQACKGKGFDAEISLLENGAAIMYTATQQAGKAADCRERAAAADKRAAQPQVAQTQS